MAFFPFFPMSKRFFDQPPAILGENVNNNSNFLNNNLWEECHS